VTSDQKRAKNKMFLEFFLGGVYFMQKCQIRIFIFNSPSGNPFGEALAPQGDLRSKKGIKNCS
jgi:hypothetical protein